MPLVAQDSLPAYETLRAEGLALIPLRNAGKTRKLLRVDLVNLMPDAALRATDRQFLRLLAGAAQDVDVETRVCTLAAEARGLAAQAHVRAHYASPEALRADPPDALIITGANPQHELLSDEPFWQPLTALLDWAKRHTRSVLCSCLATHAVVEHFYGERRIRLPGKRWGVFEHVSEHSEHPLLDGLSAPVFAPHSHIFDISRERFEQLGLSVLLWSPTAGVHLAATGGQNAWVFFQGHPEYDAVSLMKEMKREVGRFLAGEREYPRQPENFFPAACQDLLDAFGERVRQAVAAGTEPPAFPEARLAPMLANPWAGAGRTIYRNWLEGIAASDPQPGT